jgi:uncharacterized surface protein with fasciclin (FAS1) repeats
MVRSISFVAAVCGCMIASPAFASECQKSKQLAHHGGVHAKPAVQHAGQHQITQVAYAAESDIVDTAVAAGSFKTLAAALTAAGLVETLKGPGPFTVFAPTDEAFAKLPAGTLDGLLKPENKEKLKEILLIHVVPGSVYAADVVKLKEAKTAGGKTVSISTADGVKVGTAKGNSKVTKTDIKAKNGVIHVIDAVILP